MRVLFACINLKGVGQRYPKESGEEQAADKGKDTYKCRCLFSYAGASYTDGLPGIGGEHLLKERRDAQKIVKRLRRGEIGSC